MVDILCRPISNSPEPRSNRLKHRSKWGHDNASARFAQGILPSIVRMYPGKDSPFSVDSKPLSPSKEMMFTIAVRALVLAAFANCGAPLFEIHSTVINRRNYNLPAAIGESVLSVSDNPNKLVVE